MTPSQEARDLTDERIEEIAHESLSGQNKDARINFARAVIDADRKARQQEAQAWVDVLSERRRQVEAEGWTAEHDDDHDSGEMAGAASAYALAAADKLHPMSQGDGEFDKLPPAMWPWDYEWWKPGEPRRMLVKAGALILAEIERLDRAAIAKGEQT